MKNTLGTLVTVVGVALAFVVVLSIPVMLLWNYVMPTVFGLPEISILETMALLFLAEIFFKNNSSKN